MYALRNRKYVHYRVTFHFIYSTHFKSYLGKRVARLGKHRSSGRPGACNLYNVPWLFCNILLIFILNMISPNIVAHTSVKILKLTKLWATFVEACPMTLFREWYCSGQFWLLSWNQVSFNTKKSGDVGSTSRRQTHQWIKLKKS